MDSILCLLRTYARSIRRNRRLWRDLTCPARSLWSRILLLVFVHSEQFIDDHIVQRAKVYHAQNREAYEEAALSKTADIADPIQYVVHLSLDNL